MVLLVIVFNENIQSQYFVWKVHYGNEDDVIQAYFGGINHHNPKVVESTLHPKLLESKQNFQYKEVESWKINELLKSAEKAEYLKRDTKWLKAYRFDSIPFNVAVYEAEFDLKINSQLDYSKAEVDSTFLDLAGKGKMGIYLVKETNRASWKIIDFAFGPM